MTLCWSRISRSITLVLLNTYV